MAGSQNGLSWYPKVIMGFNTMVIHDLDYLGRPILRTHLYGSVTTVLGGRDSPTPSSLFPIPRHLQPGVDGGILSKDFGRQTVPGVARAEMQWPAYYKPRTMGS